MAYKRKTKDVECRKCSTRSRIPVNDCLDDHVCVCGGRFHERDERSSARRAQDERIAAEPPMPPPELPPGAPFSSVETHLARLARHGQ